MAIQLSDWGHRELCCTTNPSRTGLSKAEAPYDSVRGLTMTARITTYPLAMHSAAGVGGQTQYTHKQGSSGQNLRLAMVGRRLHACVVSDDKKKLHACVM